MRNIIQDGKRLALLTAAAFLLIVGGLTAINNHRTAGAQTTYSIAQPSMTSTNTASVPAFTCNWGTSNICRVAINGTVYATPTLINPVDGGHYILELQQDGTGHTVPLPANVVAQGGGAGPVLSNLANSMEYIEMDYVASPIATAVPEYVISSTSSNMVLPQVNNQCEASAVMSAGIGTVNGACFSGAVAANCWIQGLATTPVVGDVITQSSVSSGTITVLGATASLNATVACARVK